MGFIQLLPIKLNIAEGMPIEIYIQDDPCLYDSNSDSAERDLLEKRLYKYEVRYVNVDHILFIEPISETGYTKITLINKDVIECEQPLYQILKQIKDLK